MLLASYYKRIQLYFYPHIAKGLWINKFIRTFLVPFFRFALNLVSPFSFCFSHFAFLILIFSILHHPYDPSFLPSVPWFSLFLPFVLLTNLSFASVHPIVFTFLPLPIICPFLSSPRISRRSSSHSHPPVRIRLIELTPFRFLTRLFIPCPTLVALCPLDRRLERSINSAGV